MGNGAGVARLDRLVIGRVGAQRLPRRIEEPPELRHHPAMRDALRLRHFVRRLALPAHVVADEADALTGERVGPRIAVGLTDSEPFALLEPLEHAEQARGRPAGAFEEPHGCLIGALLLRPAVAQQRLLRQ